MDTQLKTHKSVQNPFANLTEDSVSEIIARTTPLDASRFAVISKGFKSAADSDTVWERFLPMEVLSKSDSPLVNQTKKELYLHLCNSHVLLDGGKLSSSLDKRSGKKIYMIGARELSISWGDNRQYWEWTSRADSRFAEVAQLNLVCWLDIKGFINTQMLSEKTVYSAYLVFKLTDRVYGLESVVGVVKLVNDDKCYDAKELCSLLHLHQGQPMYRCPLPQQTGRQPVRRDDGWMEIELGQFYNDQGDDGEVEACLMEISRLHWKSGLIVEGIEFRPKPIPFEGWRMIYRM